MSPDLIVTVAVSFVAFLSYAVGWMAGNKIGYALGFRRGKSVGNAGR